jgi:2-polyprenyl-3-methyl-5-hydroxy-6-metoxy-1,4-benzoquinol methylase
MDTIKKADDYLHKQRGYFSIERQDLFELVPAGAPARVLEIGAAEGSTLIALKRSGKAHEVVGVEMIALPGGTQNSSEIDRFIIADVEQQSLDLEPDSFDLIICGDVLEHMRDPWKTLQYLAGFLRPRGMFLISLPNIRYWRALGRIILGDFRYAPSGVLDRTHLRFFCKKNMLELVQGSGLQLRHVEPSFRRQPALRRDRSLNALTLGLAEQFLAQQYVILCEKP